MSIKYGNQFVDEKYASAIEPNLYTDTVLIPGVTYTDKYQEGPAGQIMVHKLDNGNAVVPGVPGRDFSDEAAKDELIQIAYNNNFQKSRKIYGVQEAAVGFAMAEEYLADALKATLEGRQYSAVACLVREGTTSNDTAEVTAANVVEKLTALRKNIKDNHGTANFALVSTDIYAILLKVIGVQSYADPAVVSGELMRRFGLTIIECNSFDKANAKYYDYAGTERTVNLTNVDMIVGYNEAFSVIDNFTAYRLRDAEGFVGSKAQVEYNTGFRVNSPLQVVVKTHGSITV